MKKIFIVAPLFLLLMNCSSFNTASTAKKGKTQQISVLDYAIEKSHIAITETLLDPKNGKKSIENTTSEIEISKFLFTYNAIGQLLNTYSCNIEHDKEVNPSNLNVVLNAKKQIATLAIDNDTTKLKVAYTADLLQQISHYEPEFKELVVITYGYNKQKMPIQARLGNVNKPTEAVDLTFAYDDKQNVKKTSYADERIALMYDDKKYIMSGQAYYTNPFNYLAIDWLTFTNYSPKNNVIRVEEQDAVTTIDYTYNENNQPTTATVTKTLKAVPNESRVITEYSFYYKEIAIPLKK